MKSWVALALAGLGLGLLLWPAERAQAIPYYARKYEVSCQTCHVSPPKLNQTGENFLANGYRFASERKTVRTLPLAVWASFRSQTDISRDRTRALPNRVEIISGGPIGKSRAFYFFEWVPLSQEVGGDGGRVARHGRFEDLFIGLPVGRATLTIGQYRMLGQVDVSRRMSISEPLAFAAGLAGPQATTGRLTSLRSFSLSGRAPAVRLSHQWRRGGRAADGWQNALTIPFTGEFVIPLTERVRRERNFEFEIRPKGVLLESFYRRGLSSIGGHAFFGDERRMGGIVGVWNRGRFFSTAAVGFARERNGQTDARFSWENEFIPRQWLALGLRIDDRSGTNRPVAVIPFANLQWPLTRQTLRLITEYRQQENNRAFLVELGWVF